MVATIRRDRQLVALDGSIFRRGGTAGASMAKKCRTNRMSPLPSRHETVHCPTLQKRSGRSFSSWPESVTALIRAAVSPSSSSPSSSRRRSTSSMSKSSEAWLGSLTRCLPSASVPHLHHRTTEHTSGAAPELVTYVNFSSEAGLSSHPCTARNRPRPPALPAYRSWLSLLPLRFIPASTIRPSRPD